MLTMTSATGHLRGSDPCLTEIPLPPEYVDVYPFLTVATKDWTKEKGWTIKVDYDFKKLFPKINICAEDLISILTTQVTDHRGPGVQSPNCPPGHAERGGYCVAPDGRTTRITPATSQSLPARTGVNPNKKPLGAVDTSDQRSSATQCRSNPAYWAGGGTPPRDVGEWAVRALERPERLAPILTAAGYDASSAPVLARMLVAKEAMLRAMWKISSVAAWSYYGMVKRYYRGEGAQSEVPVSTSDFVSSYRGLTNPYNWPSSLPAADFPGLLPSMEGYARERRGQPFPMFKPAFDGKTFLWAGIKPPFPEDKDHTWAMFAKYEGGSVFRVRLVRLTIDHPWYYDVATSVLGAIKTITSFACKLVNAEKLQTIRNTAGAVPEPNTQAVVQAWSAAAAACGMIFPATPTASCAPAPAEEPTQTEESFWDKHQTMIVAGALGLLAVVGVKALRRGKVAP